MAGSTLSFGVLMLDMWILKLDSNGTISWQKTYGGSNRDNVHTIQQTIDGGYIVAGWTASFGAGSEDMWILKLDSSGNYHLAENLWWELVMTVLIRSSRLQMGAILWQVMTDSFGAGG